MSEVTPPTLYCYVHPNRETVLRCNRCERPICSECAVLTPTGYRCKECVRGQQKIFETAQTSDYLFGIVIAGVLSFIGSIIANIISRLGILGFIIIFVAPFIGLVIAEAVRRVTHRRRSKRLFQVTAGAAALGSLPLLLINVLPVFIFGSGGRFNILGTGLALVWQALYSFLVTSSVYYRLSGIQM
ncbi:MAG TPA: hypothetical protein VKF38_08945 [Anaerolineaceae bacterium]|nr:hypothetical protein [Anaerolineaceae bacterium]